MLGVRKSAAIVCAVDVKRRGRVFFARSCMCVYIYIERNILREKYSEKKKYREKNIHTHMYVYNISVHAEKETR